MAEPITVPSCPFCEGPPVPFVSIAGAGGFALLQGDYGDEGLEVEAFVFCHECGAQGPTVEETIYTCDDYHRVELEAVNLWVNRDARHRDLYDAGEADGLNRYPRHG